MSTINVTNFLYLDNLEDLKILYIQNLNIFSNRHIIILFSIVLITIFLANKADKIIKNIGRLGTGTLAGVGAVDSVLNLYDRFIGDKNDSGSGNSGDSNNNSDKNNEDKKDDNKKDDNKKYDDKKDENNKNENNKNDDKK